MRPRLSLAHVTAVSFILLWGYTSLSKIFDFHETVVQLSKSPLIGHLAFPLAISLPIIELTLAIMLLIEKTKPLALHLSLALMVAFTTYLLVLLNYSYYIPCACGGIFGHGLIVNGKTILKLDWHDHILFNLFFVILGLLNILLPTRIREDFQTAKFQSA